MPGSPILQRRGELVGQDLEAHLTRALVLDAQLRDP